MTDYTHGEWLESQTARTVVLQGDEAALKAIRDETREYHGVDDVTDDAPVYLYMGAHVKGHGPRSYEVPTKTVLRYIHRPVDGQPYAAMPEPEEDPFEPLPGGTETGLDPSQYVRGTQERTRRQKFLDQSRVAEGADEGLLEVVNRTRLYYELPTTMFPMDGQVRWFLGGEVAEGLYVLGPGDEPKLFQTPMDRVGDIVVPRPSPRLPWIAEPTKVR